MKMFSYGFRVGPSQALGVLMTVRSESRGTILHTSNKMSSPSYVFTSNHAITQNNHEEHNIFLVSWLHRPTDEHDGGCKCSLHCLLYSGESSQNWSLWVEGNSMSVLIVVYSLFIFSNSTEI